MPTNKGTMEWKNGMVGHTPCRKYDRTGRCIPVY